MPEWKYLWSEAFKSRYVLAAWLLKDCKNIVEIGGYRTPITDFLDLEKGFLDSVTVFDPKMEPRNEMYHGKCGNVRIDHYSEFWNGCPRFSQKGLGIALLGLELHLTEEAWASLSHLIRSSQRTVIEYPIAHPHSVAQYAKIINETGARAVFQVTMELTGNDFGDLTGSAPAMTERRVVCLGPR